ncbi:hypothetical protein NWP21_13020 [Anabaenopsis sp. FSS-46]|uniref:hypothetical protein n=1 Tax=Anabaenopsis sp. FSS-46 TaxID=2971766 RepID=UPI0024771EAE|nr:hypothetical protein [Anabaenopsis sp. FSS-46]MDH6099743.1 hypothetical protein [Anabaenopsis sp. FSS-46]
MYSLLSVCDGWGLAVLLMSFWGGGSGFLTQRYAKVRAKVRKGLPVLEVEYIYGW